MHDFFSARRLGQCFFALCLFHQPVILAQRLPADPARPLAGFDGRATPLLPLRAVPGFLKLPANFVQGEVAGVALNAEAHIFLLQRATPNLSEFDSKGRFLRSLADGLFTTPHGLRIDADGNLWVTDTGSHLVLKLNPEGRVLLVLGHKGDAAEADWLFNRPADVGFAANGDFFVADGYGNSRIMRFDANGRFLKSWGHFGSAPGEFNLPHSVVVDAQGRIYVADRENARIQIFADDGSLVGQWTNVGYPFGLFMAPDQHLWVSDGGYDRILELDLKGKILGTFGSPGHAAGELAWPHFLAVGPHGTVYVADVLNWRLDVFEPTGSPSQGTSPYLPTIRMFNSKKPSVGWANQPAR